MAERSLLHEYIARSMSAVDLEQELMRLVSLYNAKKETYLLILAAEMDGNALPKGGDTSLAMFDYHIVHEILRHHQGQKIDVYLETPGGSGEAAEEIVKFLHDRFETVDFVVAGEAKSAGTLMALSADEIYMTESGSLGPVDAQVRIGRSTVSAFDYVRWVERMREEAATQGKLNAVDATMIAQITPGEFEGVYHAQEFAKERLKEWLPKYKFKHWSLTETHGNEVTEDMKRHRAEEIANRLIDRETWRSHGRSLKIEDLESIGLRIKALERGDTEICDTVYRVKAVLRLLFGSSTHFKAFVTADEKIFRDAMKQQVGHSAPQRARVEMVEVDVQCQKCGRTHHLYAMLEKKPPPPHLQKRKDAKRFPKDNILTCACGYQINLSSVRNGIERDMKKKVVD